MLRQSLMSLCDTGSREGPSSCPSQSMQNRDRAVPTPQPTARECRNSRLAHLLVREFTLAHLDEQPPVLAFQALLGGEHRRVIQVIESEARPGPLLRRRNQAALYRIGMHVVQFLPHLVFAVYMKG